MALYCKLLGVLWIIYLKTLVMKDFRNFVAVLNKKFSSTQSFPVGQPDGGRDTLVYFMDKPNKDFIVFQVKYVRNANKDKDIHKWFVDVVNGEAEKINKLIPKGAKQYYLLTNVKATGHFENGTIDKLNCILESKIKVPSICWWREDLSRILEEDPIFKWSFPEILNGQDIINSTLFSLLNENKERRKNVIRAYLTDQYDMDNEVKFKQVDLQNRLYDLFIDVPIRAKNIEGKPFSFKKTLDIIGFKNNYRKVINSHNYNFVDVEAEGNVIGAAKFLLDSIVQEKIGKILLEGGPGQGKSTISQYLCQVHRSRLLNKVKDLELLPEEIKNSPIRLPFKIDLRHVSSWIENKNPYNESLSDRYFNEIWDKSLESFLTGHIFYHSKIKDFCFDDFIAISKVSPILFVFDGFDEIANLEVRKDVIEFINKGINRISINSKSIQVVITSRPAAFTENVSFSEEIYPHFELTDISLSIIDDYVSNWISASRLNSKEASEIRRLVKEKLRLSHLRELAKTPMQLAIFLSLLRTEGESLPNKRTALYDSYIRLFFNRESEKNFTIRKYRDLIIQIHEYLAWVLHSEAELYNHNGTIQIDELKRTLNSHLESEGHKTEITDKLFQAVKERVCALVSRVQGTFEFEVQPLREYFCAKYLYKTKPYSPAGSKKSGTLPDRFDAVSRNFYWQNVVRFFAGCFDKGELSMLIQKLKDLVDNEHLKYTNYPRIITSQLLSDYVFTQYPLLLKDVVKIIIDGVNLGNIINQKANSNNDRISLPLECGRVELIDECFKQLEMLSTDEYTNEIIELINNNPDNVLNRWCAHVTKFKGANLTRWLIYAYKLRILHLVDDNLLKEIIEEDNNEKGKRLEILIHGNRLDLVDDNKQYKNIVLNEILSGNMEILSRKNKISCLEFLSLITCPLFIYDIFNIGYTGYYRNHLERFSSPNFSVNFEIKDKIDEKIKSFADSIEYMFDKDINSWRTSINEWSILVEKGLEHFGHCWSFYVIAVIAAGIKSINEKYEDFSDLSNITLQLCKRARYARLRSGNIKYWESHLTNENDLLFKLLLFFTWATPRTMLKLKDIVSLKIETLNDKDFTELVNSLRITSKTALYARNKEHDILIAVQNGNITNKYKYLLSFRLSVDKKLLYIYIIMWMIFQLYKMKLIKVN